MNAKLLEAFNTAFHGLQDLDVTLGVQYTTTRDMRYIHAKFKLDALYDALYTLQHSLDDEGEKKDA